MSTVKVENDKFPDIIIQFMLDYMMSDDMIPDNENWAYIMQKMEGAGMKAQLMKYYLSTNAIDKSKYKDIKKIFHTKTKSTGKETINIVNQIPDTIKKKSKVSGISKIIKNVLKLIKSHRERHYGMPLHEDTIDKIIEKVLKESDYKGELNE